MDKPWTTGVPPHQQPRHKPFKDFTYWPVLGYFNNWNIIHLSYKVTSSEYIDKIHQVVTDVISDNMSALVKTVQYGDINTTYINTILY